MEKIEHNISVSDTIIVSHYWPLLRQYRNAGWDNEKEAIDYINACHEEFIVAIWRIKHK